MYANLWVWVPCGGVFVLVGVLGFAVDTKNPVADGEYANGQSVGVSPLMNPASRGAVVERVWMAVAEISRVCSAAVI